MKLVTYSRPGEAQRAGVLGDGGLHDAGELLGSTEPVTVRGLLAGDQVARLAERLDLSDADPVAPDSVTLGPPVPDPDKIICVGLNYRSHAEEAGMDPPAVPTIFAKFRNALTGPDATVTLPESSRKVDYEAEVAFVIGRRTAKVAAADALEHVAGYMLFNDLSARDLQFATPQWMPGKIFDGSAPCGPWLVTPDEAGPHDAISFELKLNGEQLQAGATDDLIFSVPQLIEHLSSWMTLEPGDIVSTGTPSGVGSVRDPRIWLKTGDRIEIGSPTLGVLRTDLG